MPVRAPRRIHEFLPDFLLDFLPEFLPEPSPAPEGGDRQRRSGPRNREEGVYRGVEAAAAFASASDGINSPVVSS